MFSSALKSISSSSNIGSHYSIAATPTSTAGPWKIYDAKKKSTGKAYSVFVFDRKALDAHGSSLGRAGASAFKRAADEVVERLKKEASSLARLRHPSVLELVEPVEETRGGGLQFATEAVTASLAGLLQEKDEEEGAGSRNSRGGSGSRNSSSRRRYVEDADGVRRRREVEIDELEIQKGLLQLGKALEFLHENAGLVHGNLTPDAVLVNAKSDWKISGLAFCSPADSGAGPTSSGSGAGSSFAPVNLHEILNIDTRLPRSVQLNLDYAAPDLVLDNNLTPAADLYSLGLLCVALYNSPHKSPLEAHASLSAYRRLFAPASAASSAPTPANNFLSSRPLPRDLAAHVLPRLLGRRPVQRLTAREFQASEYFDNILVSTIRFLDAFPAKTAAEKGQFMRGLFKVLPSFPKAVMEKKVLPALLDELKDRELAPQILQNIFRIVDLLPSARRVFSERVLPALKALFIAGTTAAAAAASAAASASASTNAATPERDPARDASLMVVLERLQIVASNTNGKEFKDDILPIVALALESPTPSVVDAALRSIPVMLPVLDFSTIKHELFPVVALIFSKTNSLAIKVRGLQAFVILCGGSLEANAASSADDANNGSDGLDGLRHEPTSKASSSSSTALDKFTMQEKIVPLIKAIKTKEPAVMMEALAVLRVVGRVADVDFVAREILPILWHMALGPLLNLQQFQAFMRLIKSLSARVEEEHTKKLHDLSTMGGNAGAPADSLIVDEFATFGRAGFGSSTPTGSASFDHNGGGSETLDFEQLVKGKAVSGGGGSNGNSMFSSSAGGWTSPSPTPSPLYSANRSPPTSTFHTKPASTATTNTMATSTAAASTSPAATFAWSTPVQTPAATPGPQVIVPVAATSSSTSSATAPQASLNSFFPSMVPSSTQFSQALPARPLHSQTGTTSSSGLHWSTGTAATAAASNPWGNTGVSSSSSFTLPPPPSSSSQPPSQSSTAAFRLPPPPGGASAAPPMGTSAAPSTANYNRASLGLGGGASGMGMGGMSGIGMGNSMGNSMGMSMNMSTNTTGTKGMGMNGMGTNGMNMGMGMNTNMGMGAGAGTGMNMGMGMGMMPTQPGKTGLDKYESLL